MALKTLGLENIGEKLKEKGLSNPQFVDEDLVNKLVEVLGSDVRADAETFAKKLLTMIDTGGIGTGRYLDTIIAIVSGDGLQVVGALAMAPAIWMMFGPKMHAALKDWKDAPDGKITFDSLKRKALAIIDSLVKLANELDARGFHAQADAIDELLKRGL